MNNSILKPITLGLVMTIGMSVSNNLLAEAFYKNYLNDQNMAVYKSIHIWANNGSNQELSQAILDIVSAEMSYGIENRTLDSDQFVMHLASDSDTNNGFEMKSEYDMPVLAYRIFKHKVKKLTGFQPDIKALFNHKQFQIHAR